MTRQSPLALSVIGLLDVFSLDSSEAVRQRVVDSAAETFEAEIVGIVCGDELVAAVGLGPGGADAEVVGELIVAARSPAPTAVLGRLGELHVASLPIDGSDATRFVMARSSCPFEPEELRIGRAIVRLMRLAVRTIIAFDEQREAARKLESEVARNRELADELHRRHGDLMGRMLDIHAMLSTSAGSVLAAIVDQAGALFDGDMVGLHLVRADGKLELRQLTPNATDEIRRKLLVVDPDRGLAGRAIGGNALIVADSSDVVPGITAGMSAPVHQRRETVGALTVASTVPGRRYAQAERETLLLLAGYASVAVNDSLINVERQQALELAEWQATHDPLTGLANRRLVLDTIDRHLSAGLDVVVLYIDVDRFKSVNDLYGHQVGDEFICELAGRLLRTTRQGDLVGRLAGDEFIVVCGGASLEDPRVLDLAARVGLELSQTFETNGRSITQTVSVGLATSEGVRTASDLIHAADVAMYQAKSGGRNLPGLFDEDLQRRIRRRASIAARVEAAAVTGEGLHLVYQPIVDIETSVIVGHEALLRLTDPVLGSVPPDEFIPRAEELGIIVTIDNWVLRTALGEAAAAGDGKSSLSVNVSPAWLVSPSAVDQVVGASIAAGFPLDRLSLEVTERVALAGDVTSNLHDLRRLGVRILLDDFGTGYSSLAYVRTLEIDGIKIDRGFLDGVEGDRHRAAILEAVLTLTDRLEAVAIAEGVESAAQARLLRSFGCRLAQGFHFGRPERAPAGLRAGRLPADGLVGSTGDTT